MSRQETIEVRLQKSTTYASTLKAMQDDAAKLQAAFGAIKVGDSVKALKDQSAAAKEAAKAAQEQAKAEKEAANAEKARYQAVKELESATKEKLQAQKEAYKVVQEEIKTEKEAANAAAARAKARREETNAKTAEIRQQNLINQGIEKEARALRNLGQEIGQVNKEQYQNIQYMRQYIQNQNGMANAQVTATGAIRNAQGTFQTYNAALTEAGNVTHNYRFAVNEATGEVYQLDKGIKTSIVSIRDLSSTLRAIRTVVGFTGIAQSLRSAFSEMKDMSDRLAEYRKVTGATAQEMEQIRATSYTIAKSYGESASDVIASAANMARAGYRENSVAMAELATRTKLVGDMTQEAADKFLIAVDAAYKFQGNVEQLSAVLDAANAIDNNFATTIEKVSDGMTLVASLASTAHVPVEQLMAALGTMTAVTQRSGTETARGLRSIILNVMGDTSTEIEEGVTATEESVKSMTDALLKYGDASLKASIQAGKVINPMEAIVALQKAWKDNQIQERDLYKISEDVAGKRYYNVFTALIQNPEMYNEMLQTISQSMGSAQNEIDILMDSWSKKLEKLKTTWTEMVNTSISEGFIKDLIDGAQAGLEFAGSLENVAIMAGGAYRAIQSLSAGFDNLSKGRAFGGFNVATAAIGVGITAIGAIKSAYEANQRKIQEDAQKAVESAVASATTYNSLEELTRKYDEIARNGIQEEQGELGELKSLQSQLNDLVGDQATGIDIVNGKYGDTLTALKKITEEQRKAAIATARASLSAAVADFKQADLNGTFTFGNSTGLTLPFGIGQDVVDYINELTYLKLVMDQSVDRYGTMHLHLTEKPENAEGIVAFYNELQDFYNYIGSTTIGDGTETIGEKFSSFYTSLGAFVSTVNGVAGPVKEAKEVLDELNEGFKETGNGSSGASSGAAGGAASGVKTLTDAIDALTPSIEAATKAKEKFDDAMSASKADAFNDYLDAFNTFKAELDAGRVNSTAMYAAARMLLGEEAYNATGGTSQGVMAAMARSGSAGSVMDAWNILNGNYVDDNGNKVEGAGVYELIRQSGVIAPELLRSDDGYLYVPQLTKEQISRVSNAYGGILEEVIINALNALDQYDIEGKATDSKVKTDGKKTLEAEEADALGELQTETENTTKSFRSLREEIEAYREQRTQEMARAEEERQANWNAAGIYINMQRRSMKEYLVDPWFEEAQKRAQEKAEQEAAAKAALVNQHWWAKYATEPASDITLSDGREFAAPVSSANLKGIIAQVWIDSLRPKYFPDWKGDTLDILKLAQEGKNEIYSGSTGSALDAYRHSSPSISSLKSGFADYQAKLEEEKQRVFDEKVAAIEHKIDVTKHWFAKYLTTTPSTDKSISDGKEFDATSPVNTRLIRDAAQAIASTIWGETGPSGGYDATGKYARTSAGTYSTLKQQLKEFIWSKPAARSHTQTGPAEEEISYSEMPNEIVYDAKVDTTQAEEDIEQFVNKYDGEDIALDVKQKGAEQAAIEIEKAAKDRTATISVVTTSGISGGGSMSIGGGGGGSFFSGGSGGNRFEEFSETRSYTVHASGTRSHAGGPALVNDGGGAELLVDNGRAYIANGGRPAIVNLGRGAKVFTAQETRGIFGGRGVPAYAMGTKKLFTNWDTGAEETPLAEPGSITGIREFHLAETDDGGKKTTGSTSGSGKKKYTFSNLEELINYIIGRIGDALEEQTNIIDKQIEELKAQREAMQQQNELEKLQESVAEAQADLMDAMNERTVRYIDENGQWHWMADAGNVKSAREALEKNQQSLADYEDELAFNARVAELEAQKTALQDEYNQITKAWSDIQSAVKTPTGDVYQVLSSLLASGSGAEKKGASAVKSLLISSLLQGGSYAGNYTEALGALAQATSGSPIMPGESEATLASLIALGGGGTGTEITDALRGANSPIQMQSAYTGTLGAGVCTNYNYFINGLKLGADQADQPLSSVMKNLSIYTNTGVY